MSEHEAGHEGRVPDWLLRLALQVLYIAPLFWFMELLQNLVFLKVAKNYGWYYPLQELNGFGGLCRDPKLGVDALPWAWLSVRSFPLWAGTVAIFSMLDHFWFERRDLRLLWRALIAGLVGWGGEWAVGYASRHYLHSYLQIWPGTTLVYVSFTAIPFWISDFYVFHWLTLGIRTVHLHRAPRRARTR
ncbi:MAG TPA: hypothetical protein VGP07_06990 [Polyangia bacterium]|jgi:hypothetical protein